MSVADLNSASLFGDGQFYALSVDIAYYLCVAMPTVCRKSSVETLTWVFPNPSS